MSELSKHVFRNTDSLPEVELSKYIIAGVEAIKNDLTNYQSWDGNTPVACVALDHKEGVINQAILHMEGFTDSKRVDAKMVLGENYTGGPDHQIRIGKVNLSMLRWRGNLISDWVKPSEFDWIVQRPSTTQESVFRDLDKTDLERQGGAPLWMRAIA